MQTLLAFIVVFGIIVIVHEFGHFYFAKKSGILVREFAIGMGPKLFQTQKNETTYTIRILPLGGYVLMAGYEEQEDIRLGSQVLLTLDENEHVDEINLSKDTVQMSGIPIDVLEYDLENEMYIKGSVGGDMENVVSYPVNEDANIVQEDGTKLQIAPADRQFQNAPLLNRMLTNFGGPLNNFILSIVAFILLAFMQGGVPADEPLIGDIMEGTPAAETQLEEGDRVRTINGDEVTSWNEMVLEIRESPNETLLLEIEKPNQETYTQEITPNAVETADGTEVGQIGVSVFMKDSFVDKIKYGFIETWNLAKTIVVSLAMLVTGQLSLDNLGGPVAIYNLTGEVTQTAGLLGIISFIGYLSVNLGLVNLFPIPALDGGKLVLNIIEGIRGKPLSPEREAMINLIGVVLLLLLMLFVTWNDIQRYFFN
jgi:regulator of sigma E protease